MKAIFIAIFFIVIVLFTFCKKNNANYYPPKLQYAVFSDVANGRKLTGVKINLLSCLPDVGPGGVCVEGPVLGMLVTDTGGRIEFSDNKVTGFDCAAQGFYSLHRNVIGRVGYDGLTYNVELMPEAYFLIHLMSLSSYPTGYKLSLQRICGDFGKYVNIEEQIGIFKAIDTSIIITAGGDVNNEIRWALSDDNYKLIAEDTIRNIFAPRNDTTILKIEF